MCSRPQTDKIINRLIAVLIIAISFGLFFHCEQKVNSLAKQIISKHKVIYTQPPKKIPVPSSVDAPMLGNGYTGIAISGPPQKQVYYIARNDFWRLKHGYNMSFPAVLGKLEIALPGLEGSNYQIEQDLYGAKTWSKFSKAGKEVHFSTYVSATEDLMIVEISLKEEGVLSGNVNLELPGKQELADNLPEGYSYPAETQKGITPDGIGYISRAFVEDVDIPTKASVAFTVVGKSVNTFKVTKEDPVTIAVAFSSNFKSDDCLDAVTQRLAEINAKELKDIKIAHETWWKEYWSMSYVDIDDDII